MKEAIAKVLDALRDQTWADTLEVANIQFEALILRRLHHLRVAGYLGELDKGPQSDMFRDDGFNIFGKRLWLK